MTNNIDRAAEVIHDHHDNCLDAANALADAGLLSPDLAHTVAEQAETIQTLSRLLAGAEEAATERAAQIKRLRREVAAFRDQMTKSAEEYKAMYDRDRDLDHLLAAEYDRQIAYVLNRILEGDRP